MLPDRLPMWSGRRPQGEPRGKQQPQRPNATANARGTRMRAWQGCDGIAHNRSAMRTQRGGGNISRASAARALPWAREGGHCAASAACAWARGGAVFPEPPRIASTPVYPTRADTKAGQQPPPWPPASSRCRVATKSASPSRQCPAVAVLPMYSPPRETSMAVVGFPAAPACHARQGRTARAKVLGWPLGQAAGQVTGSPVRL